MFTVEVKNIVRSWNPTIVIFLSCHYRMNYILTYYITLKNPALRSGKALSKSTNETY